MCRMAAYTGPALRLRAFLLDAPHSLVVQAHAPRETLSATVNADGIGFGWYDDHGEPAVYRSPLPAWADPNLDALGRSLERPMWIANVRSATDPLSHSHANTQPFQGDGLLFLHNGFIEAFARDIRPHLRARLSPELDADINGTTDSEYLFALLREHLRATDGDLPGAIRATMSELRERLSQAGRPALLNLLIAQGPRLIVVRHSHGLDCPSLYTHTGHPGFSGGQLAASEPLDDHAEWNAVPAHHLVILEPGSHAQTAPL
ncbi:class II glutamine amidotransferase [Aquisalimonas sp.]|uniref:class II glutamine amidotransferase n=1 Tax=unclassified Aquisalimonas TaxID=2644645 RepID=UPI0025C2303E|nr:class II glutamine amidotransferase [Aquisalimonas sp.]